jgi:hypothetical protein
VRFLNGNAGLPVHVPYELTQFIPLLLIVLLTTVFYIMGHNEKSNQDVVVELNTQEAGVVELSGGAGE